MQESSSSSSSRRYVDVVDDREEPTSLPLTTEGDRWAASWFRKLRHYDGCSVPLCRWCDDIHRVRHHMSFCSDEISCDMPECRAVRSDVMGHVDDCHRRKCPICPLHRERRFISCQQDHLLVARHCMTCVTPTGKCPYGEACTRSKIMLKHVSECRDVACTATGCSAYKNMLRHYHQCKGPCAVCNPVTHWFF